MSITKPQRARSRTEHRSVAAAEPRLDGNLKAAWFVFVALLGAVVYYVVQP